MWHFFFFFHPVLAIFLLIKQNKINEERNFKLHEFIQRNVVLDIIHKYIFRVRSKLTNMNCGFNSQVKFLTWLRMINLPSIYFKGVFFLREPYFLRIEGNMKNNCKKIKLPKFSGYHRCLNPSLQKIFWPKSNLSLLI